MIVNGLRDERALFEELADDVAKAIPGLWGYVGIDLILTSSGPVVLEVNPRLTTSYIGLRKSIGRNPAELVLSLLEGNKSISSALFSDEPVVINLEQTYVQ
jgi:predicted ATP-grasp superfamily ATP-dependent carboligase